MATMTDHPKTPQSSTRREDDEGPRPGAQAFGVAAGEPNKQSTGVVKEHQELTDRLGHSTAPDDDLGRPAEEMPDPPEHT